MIGILCGLQSEAKIADRIPGVLVGCTGAELGRAHQLVDHMVQSGAKRLISFGLAGALSPDLVAGDLLLGATVVSNQGAWEADDLWNRRLIQSLNCYHCAPIWGSDVLLRTTEDKRIFWARSGCLAADMESHLVAAAATKAKIPFNVMRAVADTATMELPPAALVPLKSDGHIDLKAVLTSVKAQPSQIPDLIRLARYTSRAMNALREAVDVICEVYGVKK